MFSSIRASSLPLAFRCAQSLRPRPPVIDERNEAADIGTAAHDWCASGRWELETVDDYARKHGVDADELRGLCRKALRLATHLGVIGGDYERSLEAMLMPGQILVTGHIDWSERGYRARVLDWKFGMKGRDHYEQMRAYAALLMLNELEVCEVQTVTVWVRSEEFESELFDRSEPTRWGADVARLVDDETYRPGVHCQHCRRLHECEAGTRQIARDLALFGASTRDMLSLPPGEAIDLLEKADMVAALAARVRSELRDHVLENGDMEAPDGRRLTIATQKRRHLKVLEAWPILEERFSPDELASAITVSLSDLEAIVASKAQRGQGAARKRHLSMALEGAIEFHEIPQLVVRRK